MTQQAIQLLAALANAPSRERFARVTLAGDDGMPADPKLDRLLVSAGAAVTAEGRTVLDVRGIRAALDSLRAARDAAADAPLIESLPRRRGDRIALLQRLVIAVLPDDEHVHESTLNERLAAHVVDVALFRRAMFDHGLVDRDPHTQLYSRE